MLRRRKDMTVPRRKEMPVAPASFPNTDLIDHPLIQHKLAMMREKETSTQDFRTLLREISMLMGYELLRDLPTEETTIETPLEKMKARKLTGKKLCIVPILRAGLGFVDGLLAL